MPAGRTTAIDPLAAAGPLDWWPPAIGLAAAAAFMLALWLVQLRTRDAGLVDFGWASSIGALAVAFAVTGDGSPV
jgi:steroid 5-alpha reductase family enzyme